MELEKIIFVGLVFGHPYCSSINRTQFNVEHENACSFPYHIGSSISTIRDMYSHVISQKKLFYKFSCKIHHI